MTSFLGKGLLGYTFSDLKQKDMEIYYIEVKKGHDVFMISKRITRTYYVVCGSGYFTINGERYDVGPGIVVEIPPKVEYCYSGKMTLLGLSRPRWFRGNDTFTRWNPDVVGPQAACTINSSPWMANLIRGRVLGKFPISAWLRWNQRLWDKLPTSLTSRGPIRRYGDLLHSIARAQGNRTQALATLFLRNRSELDLIRRLVKQEEKGAYLNLTVFGCSTGAEAYSIAWTIKAARPDLNLRLHAVDISPEAVEYASGGVYPLGTSELSGTQVLEAVTPQERDQIFDVRGDQATVKPWLREGIDWRVGDAGDLEMTNALGPQDIVIANNFLCHMEPADAERCLRNIVRLVSPGGYLFVSGVDLDVRTKVARDLGWVPLQELLEEIHEGDSYLRRYWPSQYAGLEPLNKKRNDWRIRYAACFRVAEAAAVSQKQPQDGHDNFPSKSGPTSDNAKALYSREVVL